jgi:uncharacterized protein (TIGR01244 family)
VPEFRIVTDHFSVSPQMSEADVRAAAAAGFTLIINNRPDGEDAGQPSGARIEAAARASGLDYRHIPVIGRPSADQVGAVRETIDAALTPEGQTGKVLAYCRSGTRSITAWALGRPSSEREDVLRRAKSAGYDLSAVLPKP